MSNVTKCNCKYRCKGTDTCEHIFTLAEFKVLLNKMLSGEDDKFKLANSDLFFQGAYKDENGEFIRKVLFVIMGRYWNDIHVDEDVFDWVKDFLKPEKDFYQTTCDENGCEEIFTESREGCCEIFDARELFRRDKLAIIDEILLDLK